MVLTKDQELSIHKIQDTFAQYNDTLVDANNILFDTDLMRRARVVDATSAGKTIIEIDIGESYSNRRGIMHGGAAALILDQFTTAAFIPLTPMKALQNGIDPPGGVTRSIHITYLRPLPLPATVRVEAEVMQFGRSMSLVRGNITSKDGKKVYFTCEHHKANGSATSRGLTMVDGGKAKL